MVSLRCCARPARGAAGARRPTRTSSNGRDDVFVRRPRRLQRRGPVRRRVRRRRSEPRARGAAGIGARPDAHAFAELGDDVLLPVTPGVPPLHGDAVWLKLAQQHAPVVRALCQHGAGGCACHVQRPAERTPVSAGTPPRTWSRDWRLPADAARPHPDQVVPTDRPIRRISPVVEVGCLTASRRSGSCRTKRRCRRAAGTVRGLVSPPPVVAVRRRSIIGRALGLTGGRET
jgi:hypothetical protein